MYSSGSNVNEFHTRSFSRHWKQFWVQLQLMRLFGPSIPSYLQVCHRPIQRIEMVRLTDCYPSCGNNRLALDAGFSWLPRWEKIRKHISRMLDEPSPWLLQRTWKGAFPSSVIDETLGMWASETTRTVPKCVCHLETLLKHQTRSSSRFLLLAGVFTVLP